MQIFYDEERTKKARDILGSHGEIQDVWKNEFRPSRVIGNCTNLFRKLNPKSPEDFYCKYFYNASLSQNQPIYERGLTCTEFMDMVYKYHDRGNEVADVNYGYSVYFNDALCHVITETFNGKRQEVDFKQYLTEKGMTCQYVDGRIDSKYGIDIMVSKDGKPSFAVQIKPETFYLSNRVDVVEDRNNMVAKYSMCERDLGIRTFYVIYRRDDATGKVYWLNDNGNYAFSLDKLFDLSGDVPYVKTLTPQYGFSELK